MIKFLKFIFIIVLFCFNFVVADEIKLRDYEEIVIPAGTFIPIVNMQEFSTAYCEEGEKLSFVTTSDIFLYNKNVIPQGTKLCGYIETKNEPIKGTHASMKIFINKMYLPDGYEIPIKSYLYTANNNLFGGGLTEPATYNKVPHYQRWTMFRAMSTVQYVPGGERKMGEHITIASGANLLAVTVQPIFMTHLLIN